MEYAFLDREGRPFPDPDNPEKAENPWWSYPRAIKLPGFRYEAPPAPKEEPKVHRHRLGERRFYVAETGPSPKATVVAQDGVAFYRTAGLHKVARALFEAGEIPPVRLVFVEPIDRNTEYRFNEAYEAEFHRVLEEVEGAYGPLNELVLVGASLGGFSPCGRPGGTPSASPRSSPSPPPSRPTPGERRLPGRGVASCPLRRGQAPSPGLRGGGAFGVAFGAQPPPRRPFRRQKGPPRLPGKAFGAQLGHLEAGPGPGAALPLGAAMSGEDLLVLFSVAAPEVLLSGDNALVLAVMVRPLPPHLRARALLYGLLGAYLLRGLALLFAVFLIRLWWAQVLGGLYLVYLMVRHFRNHPEGKPLPEASAKTFWRVVLLINLVDLAFAVDSILAVVAFSKDFLLAFLGVALGILFIRLLAGSVVVLMERFPGLEKVAYALVGWAGVKLFLEGTHTLAHLLHRPGLALALPKAVFRGGTCLILTVGGLLAFRKDA